MYSVTNTTAVQVLLEGPSIVGVSARSRNTRFYRPELDILRFGAFMLVFVGHTLVVPDTPSITHTLTAWIKDVTACGVPLFFVLSSYLLTELLFKEKTTTQTINIPAFYTRRILRIWPLYFAVLFTVGLAGLHYPLAHIHKGAFLAYVFLSGNLYTCLYGWLNDMVGPLWSISVEEQFYLFWPSLIKALDRKSLAQACAMLILVAQVVIIFLCKKNATVFPQIGANTLVDIEYFAFGGICSLLMNGVLPQFSLRFRILVFISGLTSVSLAGALLHSTNINTSIQALRMMLFVFLTAFGVSMVMISILGISIPKKLSFLTYLGKISFGLYLFHMICLACVVLAAQYWLGISHGHFAMKWLVGLPLTIIVSHLSYRYFETPFLRLKERFTIIESRGI
jgi:peptidoglycan/LPS O-acetylase OafA/YrhL